MFLISFLVMTDWGGRGLVRGEGAVDRGGCRRQVVLGAGRGGLRDQVGAGRGRGQALAVLHR